VIEVLKLIGAVGAILVVAAAMTFLAQHFNRKDSHE